MTLRTRRLALVVLVSLSLCGCSAATGTDQTPAPVGGVIELAVSETCAEGSEPLCTEVGGEWVVLPSAFEQAVVEDAAVSDTQQQNAVDVTFSAEGAAVLHALTNQAAQAGAEARLVFKIGGELLAAVMVMEALDGDQVTIALSPDDDPQQIVDLIYIT